MKEQAEIIGDVKADIGPQDTFSHDHCHLPLPAAKPRLLSCQHLHTRLAIVQRTAHFGAGKFRRPSGV